MSSDIDAHLGKRLRRERRRLGLTQRQLAEAVGIRFQQIHKYECGQNRISAARLWQIAKIFEVPVSCFYEGLETFLAAQETTAPAVSTPSAPELTAEDSPRLRVSGAGKNLKALIT